MILIRVCWYLCGMFLVSEFFLSAITVTPAGRAVIGKVMVLALVLGVVSGLLAVLLKRQFRKNPDSFIFRSKTVSGTCLSIAVIMTLMFLFGVAG
jgi:hypothetical protein